MKRELKGSNEGLGIGLQEIRENLMKRELKGQQPHNVLAPLWEDGAPESHEERIESHHQPLQQLPDAPKESHEERIERTSTSQAEGGVKD